MKNFFEPQSVAVIGASPTEGKVGNIILNNLINYGFEGKIFPINPKHEKIENLRAYKTVLEVEEKVDLAIIAVPAQFVLSVLEECAQRSEPIKNIIIISAGFGESGKEGRELEKKIIEVAKKNDLKILGPNCLGTVNTFAKLNASFAKTRVKKGDVALIMQSGAFTTALFDLVNGENFGFSKVATLGNKTLLTEIDFLEYFAEDEESKIVVLYLESISDGKNFKEMVGKVSAKKPVLVLKAGNSEKVKDAIMSHTGSMAGEADVVKQAIEDCGGIFFENARDLFSAIKYFQSFSLPVSDQVVILSNAGGPGVITTDLVENSEDVEMIEFENAQKDLIKKVLPRASSVENPIDILGDAGEDRYEDVLENLKNIDKIGVVLAIVTPQAQTNIEKISEVLIKANGKASFPVIPVVMGYEADEIARKTFDQAGISNFKFPSDAVRALELAYSYKKRISDEKKTSEAISVNKERYSESQKIFSEVLSDNRDVFYYEESLKLAGLYEFNAIPFCEVDEKLECLDTIQYPIVAKIDSPNLLHKNSKNGLELGIVDKDSAEKAIERLQNDFPGEKIIVQSQVESGLEVIFGIKKDPNFGTVFMCGLGGILTEIFNEKMIWFLPVSAEKIVSDLENSKIGKVLKKQKIDIKKFAMEAEKIAQMGFENEWIKELDVNPIIFYKDKDPISVDIKVIGENL